MRDPEATAELVRRARRGDAGAFEALVRAHLRGAYAIALAVLGRPADAEDVAQDACLAAFERLDTCRDDHKFAAWLLQIARNRARNALDARRLRDVPREAPVEVAPADAPNDLGPAGGLGGDAALRARLVSALGRLTAVQREVVLLHDLDEWTHEEIAALLGTSATNSRQHLFQARRTLRALLAADAPLGALHSDAEVNHGR